MFNGEKSRNENVEKEKSPKEIVNNAVSAVENKDATNPVLSSEWTSKAKSFTKTSGEVAGILGVALLFSAKILYGVFKFAKKAIEKEGKIGFGEGYKIGEEILSFDNKKDKN